MLSSGATFIRLLFFMYNNKHAERPFLFSSVVINYQHQSLERRLKKKTFDNKIYSSECILCNEIYI
jgi:hypothetical protein